MIVPQYCAEGRLQHRDQRRQVTVRRFGWSDVSQADAQANADARVQAALARVVAGETIPKREPKVAYHGAAGVPIREEIVGRHGDTIITRNSYGAPLPQHAERSLRGYRFPGQAGHPADARDLCAAHARRRRHRMEHAFEMVRHRRRRPRPDLRIRSQHSTE
jgi:hypothetical protein